MNTKDITEREFETLGLIRDLKEFIKDKPQFKTLDDAVVAIIEGQSINRDDFIKDINVLTENGYVKSYSVEGHIPVVEDITMQGVEILQGLGNSNSEKTMVVNNIINNVTNNTSNVTNNTVKNNINNKNYSLEVNPSVVGGVEASLIDNPLVEMAGKALKGVVDKVTKKS